jgi:RNA polymerase sigma-70 factor, ECF subfamily
MPTAPQNEITRLLLRWSRGEQAALEQLLPVVYDELYKLALGYLRRERHGHTLQPTALINEAYLRLIRQDFPEWQSRRHFYGVAAQLMRQILVEYARARAADKRGGGGQKFSLDEALGALAKFDERKVRIIELRYFGGLSLEETADALGLSIATIGHETRLARAWLRREMEPDADES